MNPSDMPDETKRSTMTADRKNEHDKLEKAHKRALLELEIVKKQWASFHGCPNGRTLSVDS